MSLRGKTVLVTGATGFIGSRLVQWLHEVEGARVIALVRRFQNASRIARFAIDLRPGDVTDLDSVRAAAQGCTHIVHGAVTFEGSKEQNHRVTVDGTRNICRVAREIGAERTVYLSTISVYGSFPDGPLTEDSPCRPTDDYGRDKLEAERVVDEAAQNGLPAINLRLPVVYGPWSFWSTYAITRAARGPVLLPSDGLGLCNALYVDDAVSAVISALQGPFDPQRHTFLISAEAPCTWRAFYEEHARATNVSAEIEDVPLARLRKLFWPSPISLFFQSVWDHRSEAHMLLRVPGGRPIAKTLKWLVQKQIEPPPSVATGPSSDGSVAPSVFKRPRVAQLPEPAHVDLLAARAPANIERAKRGMGFSPHVSFDEGVDLTVKWARWAGIGGLAE